MPIECRHVRVHGHVQGVGFREACIDAARRRAVTGWVRNRMDGSVEAILQGTGNQAADQLRPRVLFHDIIEDITDQHAVILNRNRQASMILPGQSLLVYEMTPALFAAVAANEAERVAPGLTVVDVQMIGAAGRLYISGTVEDVTAARDRITTVLAGIEGRDH